MTKGNKVGIGLGVAAVVILILLWKHGKTIIQNASNWRPDVGDVQPLQTDLHTFNVPGVQFLLSLPEFKLFGVEPSCKCQSGTVH